MHIGNYKPEEVGHNLMSLELLKYFYAFWILQVLAIMAISN